MRQDQRVAVIEVSEDALRREAGVEVDARAVEPRARSASLRVAGTLLTAVVAASR